MTLEWGRNDNYTTIVRTAPDISFRFRVYITNRNRESKQSVKFQLLQTVSRLL